MMKTTALVGAAVIVGVALFAFAGPSPLSPYLVPEATLRWQGAWDTNLSATAVGAQLLSPRGNASVTTVVGTSSLQDPPPTFVLDAVTISISHTEVGAVLLDGSWTSGKVTLQGQLDGTHLFQIHPPAVKVKGNMTYTITAWFSMHWERSGTVGAQIVNTQQVYNIKVA